MFTRQKKQAEKDETDIEFLQKSNLEGTPPTQNSY